VKNITDCLEKEQVDQVLEAAHRTSERDCLEVDKLILQIADFKNDYANVAAEKLLRKCSTSWDAY